MLAMSDHERCACGRMPTLMDVQGYALWVVRCGGPAVLSPMNCWCGPSAITPKGAWEQWDRVMRAARELEQLRKLHNEQTADYAEQTADARRMSTNLDRIAEVMDE